MSISISFGHILWLSELIRELAKFIGNEAGQEDSGVGTFLDFISNRKETTDYEHRLPFTSILPYSYSIPNQE